MYLIGVRLKRGTLVAACIALAVGAVGNLFATAGSAPPGGADTGRAEIGRRAGLVGVVA